MTFQKPKKLVTGLDAGPPQPQKPLPTGIDPNAPPPRPVDPHLESLREIRDHLRFAVIPCPRPPCDHSGATPTHAGCTGCLGFGVVRIQANALPVMMKKPRDA